MNGHDCFTAFQVSHDVMTAFDAFYLKSMIALKFF